jgi:hypothetical protein
MFSFRRKVRASHTTTIWGASDRSAEIRGVGSGTLCIQVEEIGDPVTLAIYECWLLFFSRTRLVGLEAGDVYSMDLGRISRVTARCSEGSDTFLNCALLPNR